MLTEKQKRAVNHKAQRVRDYLYKCAQILHAADQGRLSKELPEHFTIRDALEGIDATVRHVDTLIRRTQP